MDPWTLRVAELNIQYYESLLAEGLQPTKAVIVRRLLAAEKKTLARLREEQQSSEAMQPIPRTASASD
jgi:hypothetical protein